MSLLFDQNLSPKLPAKLADAFPGSEHVEHAGLGAASDDDVWKYAVGSGLTIVSKDADYSHLSVVRGHPPKVLWLLVGNCTTTRVETVIRNHSADIAAFMADPTTGVLAIG